MKKRLLALVLSLSLVVGNSVISVAADFSEDVTEDVTEFALEEEVTSDDENTDVIIETEPSDAEEFPEQEPSDELITPDEVTDETDMDTASTDQVYEEDFSGNDFVTGYMEVEDAPDIHNPDMSYSYSPDEVGCLSHTQASTDYRTLSSYKTPNLPPLRDQSVWGTCWAHAATALAEISLIKQGIYTAKDIDLSEFHLAYFSYNSVTDPLGGTAGDINSMKGSNHVLNRGGNLLLAENVLASWVGAADESTAPYPTSESSYKALSPSIAYTDKAHLTDYFQAGISSDKNSITAVKDLIYNYGGVNVGLYVDERYYDKTHNSLYTPKEKDQNHDVALVGWDDNFPAANFKSKAPGNGAWIVRNSWASGSSQADSFQGYFYLSYYDKSLPGTAISLVFQKSSNYDHNYQYDGGMHTGSDSSASAAANVFTAKGNENLCAVSFYSLMPAAEYEVKIYTHSTNKVTNPESGTPVRTATGRTSFAGYYTVDLASPLYLAKDTTFAVVLTLKQNGVPLYYSYEAASHKSSWYDVTTKAASYQSFCKYGSTWQDFGARNNANLRIKAFTRDTAPKTVEPTSIKFSNVSGSTVSLAAGSKFTTKATVLPENATNKTITWSNSNSKAVKLTTSGDSATIQGLADGTATITATAGGGKVKASFTVKVALKLSSLTVSGSKNLIKGSTAKYSVAPTPSAYKLGTVTWKSSNTAVLTIDKNGTATCVGAGKAKITATSEGISASLEVTCTEPEPEPEPVIIEPEPAQPATDWGDITEEDQKLFKSVSEVPGRLWLAGYKDTLYTGYDITFNNLRVYDGKKRLTIGKDVTVKYSNNAAVSTDSKKAKIVVTGIGNFTGSATFTFNILPLDISKANLTDIALEYNGKIQKGTTKVLYKLGDTYISLLSGNDFTYDYSLVKADPGTYRVKLTGKGNFKGTTSFNEIIFASDTRINIAKLKYKAIPTQTATGSEIRPEIVITDTANNYQLTGKDMTITYYNNVDPGSATVVVTAKGSLYAGSRTISFKIKGTTISTAKASIDSLSYTGNPQNPSYTLTLSKGNGKDPVTLIKDIDYTAEITGNTEAGKGTIVFKGIGKYTGTCKKTFKINPCDFSQGSVSLTSGNRSSSVQEGFLGSYPYTKGGARPELTLYYKGRLLEQGRDYSVKYINNTEVTSSGGKPAKAVVTGKGNFKGSFTRTFSIYPSNLGRTAMTINDVVYSGKSGICKPSVTILDSNGKKLTAGVDYEKAFKFTYTDGNYKKKGVMVSSGDIIPAGTRITVTVTGKGGYAGSTRSATFTYVNRSLNNAAVTQKSSSVVFTGKTVSVNPTDFTVKTGKHIWPAGSYKIAEITPATNTGVVKVTLKGVGRYNGEYYGGQKTVSFRITAKPIG